MILCQFYGQKKAYFFLTKMTISLFLYKFWGIKCSLEGIMISKNVINEVQEKIERLKLPKGYTVRPVLIYSGVLASGIEEDGYFDNILDFDKLLTISLE